MAVLFKGKAEITINRHEYMGDGIVIEFDDFLIFQNTSGKFSLQKESRLIGDDYKSIAEAYIAGNS